jgi:hypothetical protein
MKDKGEKGTEPQRYLGECLVYFRSDKGELSEMLLPGSLY